MEDQQHYQQQHGNDQVTNQVTYQQQSLTGMQKFAWFLVGLLLSFPAVLVASLTNIDKPYRSDCTKYCLIGACFFLILFVVFMAMMTFAGVTASLLSYSH